MRISLFGNLRIQTPAGSVPTVNTNRLQSLLAYLVLHSDVLQPRERLAFLLWPGSKESQARTNLRQLIHNLKRALPANSTALQTDHFAVQWRQDGSFSVDVTDFQAALSDAEAAKQGGDGDTEVQWLTTAAKLYEDDLLPSLYDDWLTPIRDDYRRRMATALERLATIFEKRQNYAVAVTWAERLVALDPLSEAHHRLLVRLHAANHDRASALRSYHQCMRILRREMGVEPEPATKDLFERILKAESNTVGDEAPTQGVAGVRAGARLQKVRALVGRSEEWQELALAWEAALEGGPTVVAIAGEPGIGKTRLADELSQSCIRQGHAVARARCYAGQRQLAYAPVAEWLRSDAVRVGWSALSADQAAEVSRLVPEVRERFSELPAVGSGQLGTLAESWQRLRFYESLSIAIGHCRKPLLLYLDDTQWCDPDSFEWLNTYLMSPNARGVLLLLTVRTEETGRDHPFTRFVSGLRQSGLIREILLDPLDERETVELARIESANPLEGEREAEIFRATRGNPLFVVESVRAGLQSTRVHSVIATRFAQLSTPGYELTGVASVIGRPFSFELLEKVTDWDEASLSEALDELWRRRILESRGTAEYDFTHDRLREVALGELGLVRQRYLHRRVARALIEVHATDIEGWNGQIAAHFEQAGLAEEALDRYEKAAIYARQRYADADAAQLMRCALALCRGFPESERRLKRELDLLVILGPSIVTTEGYSAAEVGTTYDRALELARQLNDRNIFVTLSGFWAFHMVRGDIEKARQISTEFLDHAKQAPTPGLLQAGNFLLGSSVFHRGRTELAFEHMTAAIEMHSGPAESVLTLFAGPDVGVFCRSYLGHITWHRGDEEVGIANAEQAIASAKQMRQPFSQAIALDYAALLEVFRGSSRGALERGQEAVDLCRRHGFAYYLAMANILTGWAKAAEGNAEAGLLQLREGLDGIRQLSAELRLPLYFALLADALRRAGHVGEALASVSTGFAFASKNNEEWALPELHRVHGELLATEGKPDLARISFRRGIETARRSGSVAFERKLAVLLDGTAAAAATERS